MQIQVVYILRKVRRKGMAEVREGWQKRQWKRGNGLVETEEVKEVEGN